MVQKSMFSQRDFLRRLIQNFAEFLAALIALRKGGKLEEAEQQLGELCGALLGPLGRDAELLDSSSLGCLLPEERLERYAALIAERANLHLAKGDVSAAEEDRQRAVELYLEAAMKRGGASAELSSELRELLAPLALDTLPARYRAFLNANPSS
jgi:hypothetical protein